MIAIMWDWNLVFLSIIMWLHWDGQPRVGVHLGACVVCTPIMLVPFRASFVSVWRRDAHVYVCGIATGHMTSEWQYWSTFCWCHVCRMIGNLHAAVILQFLAFYQRLCVCVTHRSFWLVHFGAIHLVSELFLHVCAGVLSTRVAADFLLA